MSIGRPAPELRTWVACGWSTTGGSPVEQQQRWQSSEVLAWSADDGPGRPPVASRWIIGGVAVALTATLTGILSTDALCPDHRAWVQTLASVAIFSAAVAIVQVLRAQPSAIVFALLSSVLGVAIGFIDAVHDPGRGMLISLGFAIAGVGGVVVAFRMQHLARWGADLSTAHQAPAHLEPLADTVAHRQGAEAPATGAPAELPRR